MSETRPVFDRGRRLEFLDALRGWASAYVVIFHMLFVPQPNLAPPKWAAAIATFGGSGVTLFFMVSAFSLYYTMPLRLRERRPTVSFYLHRFFRIAPLFYFMIVVTLVRDVWAFNAWHSPGEVAASVTFVFNLLPTGQPGFVWAGWTIGVEMLFYAVFPLIYARIRTIGDGIAFTFACLLSWIVIQFALTQVAMPEASRNSILAWSVFKHLPVFAAGGLIYQLFVALRASDITGDRYTAFGNACSWAGLFMFAALVQGWLPNLFGDAYYWQAVVYGCLFLGLAFSPWRVVVNAVSRYLGKISYSMYLAHPTIVFLLTPVYQWFYAHSTYVTLAFAASLIATFAIVIPVASLTYELVEVPGIKLGKWLAGKFLRREDAPQLAAKMG